MVTDLDAIKNKMNVFDPTQYGRTRNYKSGDVSYLSPYISRGILSTRKIYDNLVERFENIRPFEKFIQELAWRDYWQRMWQVCNINEDLRQPQNQMSHFDMPEVVMKAKTGIHAVDRAIEELYETGYMHNHMRMYVASIVCNVGQCYWKQGARWMYAHLFDADWGSNALSWQWIAGTNSSKKYYANQDNINKFFDSNQQGTFLDYTYEMLTELNVPKVLQAEAPFEMKTELPKSKVSIDPNLPTLIYTQYNLDPEWHKSLRANRVLLLEPDHFAEYPISQKSLQFVLDLAKNIPKMQVVSDSFEALEAGLSGPIVFKEHPFSAHFVGEKEARDWLHADVPLEKSFFRYWKNLKKSLPEIA